jgi:hypothetical protein
MKYAGMGGWRAIKRISRDANIADGVAPYSYRTRYANSGGRRQQAQGATTIAECTSLLRQMRSVAVEAQDWNSNCITKKEREEIERVAADTIAVIDSTLASVPGFWASLFVSDMSWIMQTKPAIERAWDSFGPQQIRVLKAEQTRHDALKKSSSKVNSFANKLDKLYLEPLKRSLPESELAAVGEYNRCIDETNALPTADAAGKCIPWEDIRKRQRTVMAALVRHTELLADLVRRFGNEPPPEFLWDTKTGKLQLGQLKVTGLLLR